MSMNVAVSLGRKAPAVPAILVGGIAAGTLDALTAFYLYGWGMPRGIASGLMGPSALQGGTPAWILGLALHFFIALSAAAVYYGASRKLKFLAESPIVCGLFYGIAVFLVMNLIVLPLSAIHFRGPFGYSALVRGLLVHMFLIGLPIAWSVRRYAR